MTTVANTPFPSKATTTGDLVVKRATALVCGLDMFNASFLPKSPKRSGLRVND